VFEDCFSKPYCFSPPANNGNIGMCFLEIAIAFAALTVTALIIFDLYEDLKKNSGEGILPLYPQRPKEVGRNERNRTGVYQKRNCVYILYWMV
jgi:hypothetical protein